ncbi:MAG TPA: ABC transporter permease [Desulfotomaculum sp.]|nr:ABC transporter permease [Desulfotomaculum sp.]
MEAKATPTIVIKPSRGWRIINWRELWEYRELLYFFVWRDVKVRYKQTVLGAAWAILQPFLTMVVFSLLFGRLAKLPSDGIPYPIFYYSALLPWIYFATSLTNTTNIVVQNQRVITKVYFPRIILPASSVLAGLVDFGLAFTVLLAMMFLYGILPSAAILTVPLFLLFAMATALGVGLWLAAMNAIYRDVRHVVPFLVQLWMFLSPVVYPSSMIPEKWRLLYGLNPMAGVIEGFRWAMLGKGDPPALIGVSAAVVLLLLIGGLFYFRKMEGTIADVV